VLARPGFVGAAPALPGASRVRLPPASLPCCDRVSGGRSLTSARISSASRRTWIEAKNCNYGGGASVECAWIAGLGAEVTVRRGLIDLYFFGGNEQVVNAAL
jgi:hypothetical protein